MKNKNILVTGAAGFIGFHFTKKILNNNYVVGVDKISNYYSPKLKYDRLKILQSSKNFSFFKFDISNKKNLEKLNKYKFDYVVHLAAQAGVRKSLDEPLKYIDDNIVAQVNLFEYFKDKRLKKFIYASSSSIYGKNNFQKFSENQPLKQPLSLYSATKQSVEQISNFYSNYYNIKTIGLRIFTCYGPYGRPDLSVFKLTHDIINYKKIYLLNNGKTRRDFTYVDDTVEGIFKCLNYKQKKNFHEIFNLGNGKTYSIKYLASLIGKSLKINYKTVNKKHHPTDMTMTKSNVKKSIKYLKFKPKIALSAGIELFLKWFLEYYKFKKK